MHYVLLKPVHFGRNSFLQMYINVQELYYNTSKYEIVRTTSKLEEDPIIIDLETFKLILVTFDNNENILSSSFVSNIDSVFFGIREEVTNLYSNKF
jgi:hypothetical protein